MTPTRQRPGHPRKPGAAVVRLTVRVPVGLADRIAVAAADDDRSRDAWVRRACERYLRREG